MTIAQVSEKYDLTSDTLRYYEKIGLIPAVQRTKSGVRDYNEESLRWIELVKCMRSAGVSIEALAKYCLLAKKGSSTISQRKELLEGERRKILTKMEEMESAISRLNYKIKVYEEAEETGKLIWHKDAEEKI